MMKSKAGPTIAALLEHVSDRTLQASIDQAGVIVLPEQGYERVPPPFNPFAGDVYTLLAEGLPGEVEVELAATDEDYEELGLHSADVFLPSILFVMQEPHLVSVVLSVLANFVSDKLGFGTPSDTRVKASVYLEKDSGSLLFEYDGPASTFENTMKDSISQSL